LLPGARQLVVVEAKMASGLSAGTTAPVPLPHAPASRAATIVTASEKKVGFLKASESTSALAGCWVVEFLVIHQYAFSTTSCGSRRVLALSLLLFCYC